MPLPARLIVRAHSTRWMLTRLCLVRDPAVDDACSVPVFRSSLLVTSACCMCAGSRSKAGPAASLQILCAGRTRHPAFLLSIFCPRTFGVGATVSSTHVCDSATARSKVVGVACEEFCWSLVEEAEQRVEGRGWSSNALLWRGCVHVTHDAVRSWIQTRQRRDTAGYMEREWEHRAIRWQVLGRHAETWRCQRADTRHLLPAS